MNITKVLFAIATACLVALPIVEKRFVMERHFGNENAAINDSRLGGNTQPVRNCN